MNEYAYLARFHTPITVNPVSLVVNAAGGGDYTTIKAAMIYAAARASYYSPYTISVRNGTYNEIQINGADYVAVEGESKAGVIMISDGTRTDVDPVSGQRYVDMAQTAKHGWWIHHKMMLKNMTIRVNDVKYCVHEDSIGVFDTYFENVQFEHSNGYTVGVGAHARQNLHFTDCTFRRTGGAFRAGVFWHNWNNQSGPCQLTMTRCNAIDGFALLDLYELGSGQTDQVTLTDCSAAAVNDLTVTNTYYVPSGTALQVPYCINQRIINSGTLVPVTNSDGNRPNMASTIVVL